MKLSYASPKTPLLTCKSLRSEITNGRPYVVQLRDALKLDTHSASFTQNKTNLKICTSLIKKTFLHHCKYLSCQKKTQIKLYITFLNFLRRDEVKGNFRYSTLLIQSIVNRQIFLGITITQYSTIYYCHYMNKWTLASLTTDRFIKNLVTFLLKFLTQSSMRNCLFRMR